LLHHRCLLSHHASVRVVVVVLIRAGVVVIRGAVLIRVLVRALLIHIVVTGIIAVRTRVVAVRGAVLLGAVLIRVLVGALLMHIAATGIIAVRAGVVVGGAVLIRVLMHIAVTGIIAIAVIAATRVVGSSSGDSRGESGLSKESGNAYKRKKLDHALFLNKRNG
jgi:hypothetical protein